MYNHRRKTGDLFVPDNYKTVLKHLKADAYGDVSVKEKVYLRIAQKQDSIYYDLCDQKWNFVKITKDGYELIQDSESVPAFERTRGMVQQVQPEKIKGDALEEFCELFRIDEQERTLFKSHIIHLFLEDQESPIMVIIGEHGSIKTTIIQAVKKLVDPSSSNIGSLPSDKKDLPSALSNKYFAAFDNVSGFNHEISDMLCRSITGDEIAKRALYTDNDLYVMSYRRKISLNGISPNIEYPDFIDRSIVYETKPIPEDQKIPKSEVWKQYDKLLPKLLDQVFTILSQILKSHDDMGGKIKPTSRLADFEMYGETISRCLGYECEKFLKKYRQTRRVLELSNIDSYPIFRLVQILMRNKTVYEDSIQNFYHFLKTCAEQEGVDTKAKTKDTNWPKTSHHLTRQINRLRPQFRSLGFEFLIKRYFDRDEKYERGQGVIKITIVGVSNVPDVPEQNYEQKIPEQNQIDTPDTPDTSSLGNTIQYRCKSCNFKIKSLEKHLPRIEQSHQEAYNKDQTHILIPIENNTKILKKSDYWGTPPELFVSLCQMYDINPRLDVCANEKNTKCQVYFDESIDGLKKTWDNDSWCNPPYSQTGRWVQKCYLEHVKNNITVAALIMKDETTSYWRDFIKDKAEIHTLNKRVRFIDPDTDKPGDGARFVSVVAIWRSKK